MGGGRGRYGTLVGVPSREAVLLRLACWSVSARVCVCLCVRAPVSRVGACWSVLARSRACRRVPGSRWRVPARAGLASARAGLVSARAGACQFALAHAGLLARASACRPVCGACRLVLARAGACRFVLARAGLCWRLPAGCVHSARRSSALLVRFGASSPCRFVLAPVGLCWRM